VSVKNKEIMRRRDLIGGSGCTEPQIMHNNMMMVRVINPSHEFAGIELLVLLF
jgi:hypothetical protein